MAQKQESEFINRMLHVRKAGFEFHVTIHIDSSTAYHGNQSLDRIRDLVADLSLSFQIRNSDIKELAKMAACSQNEKDKAIYLR
jgi:hypothetical protein